MDLKEVLKEENNNKIFICKDNGAKVKNDGRTLLYFHNNTESWKPSFTSHVWVESEYEPLENTLKGVVK